MILSLILRLLVNAVAIWAAGYFVDGVSLTSFEAGLWVALVFGVLNALLKPLLILVTLPINLLTLGFFTLVINAGIFALTAKMTTALTVDGFWSAVWGALVVSVVNALLGTLERDDKK